MGTLREISETFEDVPYNYHIGPDAMGTPEFVLAQGINCQFLAHAALKLLLPELNFVHIPNWYRSSEFFADPLHLLESVKHSNLCKIGDIVLFHYAERVKDILEEPKQFHIGVVLEFNKELNQPTIVHTSYDTRGFAIESLSTVLSRKRHRYLMAIRRVK